MQFDYHHKGMKLCLFSPVEPTLFAFSKKGLPKSSYQHTGDSNHLEDFKVLEIYFHRA